MVRSSSVPPAASPDVCSICQHFCILGDLAHAELASLLPFVTIAQYPKRTYLYMEGNPAQFVFVVRVGDVKIYRNGPNGRPQILRLIHPGDVIGLESMVEPRYSSTAETLTEASICTVSRERFQEIIVRHPNVAVRLIRRMQLDVGFLESRVMELGARGAKRRVASLLAAFAHLEAGTINTSAGVRLDLSRQELAEMTGIASETVSRIMTSLSRAGVLEVSGRTIHVTDPGRLLELAGPAAPKGHVPHACGAGEGVSSLDGSAPVSKPDNHQNGV